MLAVAILALAAVVVLSVALVRLRRRHRELLAATEPRPDFPLRQGAQTAVQFAVQTASRLRRSGVSGMLMSSLDDLARWAAEDRVQLIRVAAADGTVTFMFTDIENSTALNEELGDKAWVRVLDAHDRLVRNAVTRQSGHVVKSQGDGYMIAFSEAEHAIAAAIDVQRTLARRRRRGPVLAVRIGIHRGTAVSRDGDYFGRAVAMAARVAAAADGGEILVSDETYRALSDPDGLTVGEPREVALKGLTGEHVLRSVTWH